MGWLVIAQPLRRQRGVEGAVSAPRQGEVKRKARGEAAAARGPLMSNYVCSLAFPDAVPT